MVGTHEVGGRELQLRCEGTGSPTVVLEGGTGALLFDMAGLQHALASQRMVCAYTRARLDQPRTSADVASDLHELLDVSGHSGPVRARGTVGRWRNRPVLRA